MIDFPQLAAEIRQLALIGIYHAGSGHPGGALSCADILAALYGGELRLSPNRLDDPARDRFVLSKGHACPALYGAAAAIGILDPALVPSLRKIGSPLQGHPHVGDLPWVETSTGSLGQGFSVAIGMALGLRHRRLRARVHVLLGDGEVQEGEVWEGAMCAAHHRLGNLCALIDHNRLQSDARTEVIMGLAPLAAKWRAFGWHVQEIDGHDFGAIAAALTAARTTTDRPSVIIAHTVKGKGVSFMEDVPTWHGSVRLSAADTRRALTELGMGEDEISEWMDEPA